MKRNKLTVHGRISIKWSRMAMYGIFFFMKRRKLACIKDFQENVVNSLKTCCPRCREVVKTSTLCYLLQLQVSAVSVALGTASY